jgi:hypothetical protein
MINMNELLTSYDVAHVPGKEGRYVTYNLSCKILVPQGAMTNNLQVPFSSASSTLGTTKRTPSTITSFFRNSYNMEGIDRRNQRIRGLDAVYIEQKRL